MFKRLESITKLILINVNRVSDHYIRFTTGLPTIERSKITKEIYLGGQYNEAGLKRLKEMGITSIVNMRRKSLKDAAEKAGINYLHLPTPDRQAPTMAHLEEGVMFMDRVIKSKGKVYVHCMSGEGRGPSMVIAYLIKTGLTLDDALLQVQKIRSFARPTKPQMKRLKQFERKYKKIPKKTKLPKPIKKLKEKAEEVIASK